MISEEWAVTVQLSDPKGSKITTESLRFSTKGGAQQQVQKFLAGGYLDQKKIYTLENEEGESVSFLGERYISHSLLNVTPIEVEF